MSRQLPDWPVSQVLQAVLAETVSSIKIDDRSLKDEERTELLGSVSLSGVCQLHAVYEFMVRFSFQKRFLHKHVFIVCTGAHRPARLIQERGPVINRTWN